MRITCFIHYTLDPYKVDQFERYARTWHTIIPKCGGDLLGYFLPHEGANNIAIALVSFESLAAYEVFRKTIMADEEGKVNFQFAKDEKFILEERRLFLRPVGGLTD